MATYCISDSHGRALTLAVDRVYDYGGLTMHAVGQFGMPTNFSTSPGDHVIACFGEVDCRVHIFKIAEQRGVGINTIITEVTTRYVERIRAFCVERQAKGYVIAAPPQAVPTTPDAIVPVVDSIAERVARTNRVNELMAQICAPDIGFIDIWGPFRNPDGSLNMAMSDGIVHAADKYRDIIRDIVLPHLTPPT